jgi:hypothetical protein
MFVGEAAICQNDRKQNQWVVAGSNTAAPTTPAPLGRTRRATTMTARILAQRSGEGKGSFVTSTRAYRLLAFAPFDWIDSHWLLIFVQPGIANHRTGLVCEPIVGFPSRSPTITTGEAARLPYPGARIT